MKTNKPTTPDGRYFIVNGRLWRCTNPSIPAELKQTLVNALMRARREKGIAIRLGDNARREAAREEIDL